MKLCSKCGRLKPISDFHKCKANKDGRYVYCILCACEKHREYYLQHIEESKDYYQKNRERILARMKAKRQANKRLDKNIYDSVKLTETTTI